MRPPGVRVPADSARGQRCRRSRKKRLAAIKEFSDLGSGFRVAALDLEIRGAGNLLGGEQSGHIEAVGFEMYMKLLEETIRELKGEDIEDDVRATVNLRVDFRIEESYIPDMNQRLMVYRRMRGRAHRRRARSTSLEECATATARCRVGAQPRRLRPHPCAGRSARRGDRRPGRRPVVFRFRPQTPLDPERLARWWRRADLTLVPPAGLRLDLGATAGRPPRHAGAPHRRPGRRPAGEAAWPNRGAGRRRRAKGQAWPGAGACAGGRRVPRLARSPRGSRKRRFWTGREDPRGPPASLLEWARY